MFRPLLRVLLLCLFCADAGAQVLPITADKGVRESNPVLTTDGNTLYFSRPDHPRNQGNRATSDIWLRTRQADGSWGRALNPGSPINSFGHDRMLSVNPDGQRIAVLRTGAQDYLDLLERKGRNWSVVSSWILPFTVTDERDVAFNVNTLRLVYAAASPNGDSDLYGCTALADGNWTDAAPLTTLNTAGQERKPSFASDGRSLYFRGDGGRWFRQDDRGQRARALALSPRYLQFCVGTPGVTQFAEAVVMMDDLGRDERLMTSNLDATDLPPAGTLARGFARQPPPPGFETIGVPTTETDRQTVLPDAYQRYALILRPGEVLFPGSEVPYVSESTPGSGGLASANPDAASVYREELGERIAYQERQLRQLDAERRRYAPVNAATETPQRSALRDRLGRAEAAVRGDTVPPSTRDRYAREVSELERMKAKFRQQQAERAGRNVDDLSWRTAPPPAAAPQSPAPNTYSRQSVPPSADERPINDEVRNNLQYSKGIEPRRTTNPNWERDLQRDLPRREPISTKERDRLDREYARKQAELESLRRQLRDRDARPAPANSYTPPPARPNTYDVRSPEPPRDAPAGIPAGVSFITNTAYPDGRGYGALDQLVQLVKNAAYVVELRVHTPTEMDRRAAQLLSEERAVTIGNYLQERGVNPRNYRVVGYGNHQTGSGGERVEILR